MGLEETIKKILIEQTIDLGERTSLESAIIGIIEKTVDRNSISKNYYGPVVDIFDTNYGLNCQITFLFKKPFKGKDSDLLHDLGRKSRKEIDMWIPIFRGGISIGNSTIDSYLNQKWWYDEKKKTNLKEESVIKEEISDPEYAVIEITKPSSRMAQKWYFQAVPLNRTQQDKIYIKRGSAGTLTISTDNIKIRKIFKKSEKEEMDKYLEKLRDEDKKIEELVIKEETTAPHKLLRRIRAIDELIESKLKIYYKPDSVCRYESDEEFLDVISYSVIETMYYSYFGDIDDNSEEWTNIFRTIEKYIQDKYGDGLKAYYRKHCTKKVETKESELTEKCWKGYTQKGMKTMFGKRYPNCVKKTK